MLISLDIIWNTVSDNHLLRTTDQENVADDVGNDIHVRFDLERNEFKDAIKEESVPNKNAQDVLKVALYKKTEEYLIEKEVIETQFSNVLIICPKK